MTYTLAEIDGARQQLEGLLRRFQKSQGDAVEEAAARHVLDQAQRAGGTAVLLRRRRRGDS